MKKCHGFLALYHSPGKLPEPGCTRILLMGQKYKYEDEETQHSCGNLDTFKLPVIDVGMIGGGPLFNAIRAKPGSPWISALSTARRRTKLAIFIVSTPKHAGENESVSFRMESKMSIDYSNALPQGRRLNLPLVQTARATANYCNSSGTVKVAWQKSLRILGLGLDIG
jgi:hypothetical protein